MPFQCRLIQNTYFSNIQTFQTLVYTVCLPVPYLLGMYVSVVLK